MPIYCEEKIIPAGTAEDTPVSLDISIHQKFITRIEIGFPDGCNYEVKVRINYGIKQFWPQKKGTWLIGNNETVGWDEKFEMPSIDEKLTVFGVSPGATYDHLILIRIMTLPKGFYFLETILQRFHKLWEKVK